MVMLFEKEYALVDLLEFTDDASFNWLFANYKSLLIARIQKPRWRAFERCRQA